MWLQYSEMSHMLSFDSSKQILKEAQDLISNSDYYNQHL